MRMRNIFCSFRNEEDLKKFGVKIGFKNINNSIAIIDLKNRQWEAYEKEISFQEYAKIKFELDEELDNEYLSELFEQKINNKTIEIWYPKKEYEIRKIICRFANKNDMEELLVQQLDLPSKDIELVKEYNLITNEIKYRQPKKPYKAKDTSWEKEWVQMPEFNDNFAEEEFGKVEFVIDSDIDNKDLKEVFKQNITDKTKSIWHPRLIQGKHRKIRVVGGRHPRYPIYVVSKGRYDFKGNTSNFLSRMGVKHYIVVEPQEVELYKQNMNLNFCTVLELDMKYKEDYDVFDVEMSKGFGCGPGAARNFVKDHSIGLGAKWHWVLDDNIENFDRYWRGHKIYSHSPEIFSTVEDFVDRYENIGQAGLNYSKFCTGMSHQKPYTMNTRIYSFILNRNDLDYRWRGTWNEDTDLSLRILKDGWCTVQFNQMLAAKMTTQKVKGGNTTEFYKDNGTFLKSKMLENMHPDVAKVVWKFSRWHHEVDYSGFKQELKIKDEYKNIEEGINEHGQEMYIIPDEWVGTDKDCAEYILAHKQELKRVDNTDLFL